MAAPAGLAAALALLTLSSGSDVAEPGELCNEACERLFLTKCLPFHTMLSTAGETEDEVKYWYLGVERGRERCAKEISDGGVWRRGPEGLVFLKGGPLLRSGCTEACVLTEKMATWVPPKFRHAKVNATVDDETGVITPIEAEKLPQFMEEAADILIDPDEPIGEDEGPPPKPMSQDDVKFEPVGGGDADEPVPVPVGDGGDGDVDDPDGDEGMIIDADEEAEAPKPKKKKKTKKKKTTKKKKKVNKAGAKDEL